MALKDALSDVDVIVMHAPGTIKGLTGIKRPKKKVFEAR
jgi:hypothetical protein